MLARYVSPSAGRCQGGKTIYYRRVWGSGRLHEWSAISGRPMMVIIILPEHVEGRFTNRRAWRVLSVGTDDDQVYMYLGKTHLPALQKGIFLHLHGRPVGVEDMPFRFSRASKFNSEDIGT